MRGSAVTRVSAEGRKSTGGEYDPPERAGFWPRVGWRARRGGVARR